MREQRPTVRGRSPPFTAMPKARPKPDSRTLVDRLLDRIKNNRVAAAAILVALGLGALANLTDSTRKLSDVLSSFSSASLAGEWKSDAVAFYPVGPEFMRLHLQEAAAGQVVGTIRFNGAGHVGARRFELFDGKREGRKLSFSFDSGARLYAGGSGSVPVRETVVGELAGDELRLVYQREGHGGVPLTARRIEQAVQLAEGRLAITYKGKEYADHRAACMQLLSELDPLQTYRQSALSDDNGDVHCSGKQADGRDGFDMYRNAVQQELICPQNSRRVPVDGMSFKSLKRCECDGRLMAAGTQCVSASQPGTR